MGLASTPFGAVCAQRVRRQTGAASTEDPENDECPDLDAENPRIGCFMSTPTASRRELSTTEDSDGSHSRARILLVAYSCIPERGSEPGTGWNHAVEAAKNFDTWVICEGDASEPEIRAYFERHDPIAGLHFEYLAESLLERLLKWVPGAKYLAFGLWNCRAGRLARRLHEKYGFDLVHQVTFTGFREPGYLWKLDATFVWGPIGGAQNYPWRFLAKGGPYALLKEGGRGIINILQMRYSPRVRRAARRATLLLAATTTNRRAIIAAHGVTPVLFPDTGVRQLCEVSSASRTSGTLRILWCGVLSPHKALHLLIEALGAVPDDVAWELHVVGDGPFRAKWQRLAKTWGVDDRISWLGWIPHRESLTQYTWADIFVFTSLRDTTGTVLPEALAAGLPIVCLDHQGAADVVDASCGIKIAVTRPNEVIAGLRQAIEGLSREPETRERLGRGASRRAEDYLWPELGKRMAKMYRRVIAESNTTAARGEGSHVTVHGESAELSAPIS